jgi:hypothetical protein
MTNQFELSVLIKLESDDVFARLALIPLLIKHLQGVSRQLLVFGS